MKTKVAVAQLSSQAVPLDNIKQIEALAKKAKGKGAQMMVLPENVLFLVQTKEEKQQLAEPFGSGPLQAAMSKLAAESQFYLVVGSLLIRETSADKVTSACLVFNPKGECIARYNKMHLFDVILPSGERYFESEVITAGEKVVVVDTEIAKLGLSICYDLRFPELYCSLANKGAQIIVVPAAFTYNTGAKHWLSLLRARAIENQCYVLAANQVGIHSDKQRSYGHSMIVSPWGEVMVSLEEETDIAVAEIDLKELETIRRQFPTLKHKKGQKYFL